MSGRRETRLNGRKPDGWWRFTRFKIRSVCDLGRISDFPRCPPAVKRIVDAEIARRLGEARRYTDADYAEVRRNLYPADRPPVGDPE